MAGAEVLSVKMDAHTKRPFSRDQPTGTRRSVSGGGDGGTAGLGQTSRSHTLDAIPGLGGHSKSRTRHGRTGGNNIANGHLGSNHINNNSSNQHHPSRQHYQHKHSRVVNTNANKNSSSSNNNNHAGNSEDLHKINAAPIDSATKDVSHGNNNNKSSKKFSRRTVSLPKAGSRLFGHTHHNNPLSSSTDRTHKHNVGNGSSSNNNNNNNHPHTNGNILISSATTNSHHSIISSGGNHNDANNNNVFPPITAGGQILATRLEAGDPEGSSLSPRNLPGASVPRAMTRGGGVAVPMSPPEVPLSRLHFLSEPTFESLHPRTPPILQLNGLANGASGGGTGGGVEGGTRTNGASGGTNGTLAAGALRNSALSPDLSGLQQHQGQQPQQPFSPSSTSEKAKGKFERKVQLSRLAENSASQQQMPTSPRAKPDMTGDTGSGPSGVSHTSNTAALKSVAKETTNNKTRMKKDSLSTSKSLPKIAPPEEPFSIRRKIEQFRKWHEEQFVDKLVRLEPDTVGKEGLSGVGNGNFQNGSFGLVDYTKVLEGKIAGDDITKDTTNAGGNTRDGVSPKPHIQHFGRGPEQTWARKHPVTTITNGGEVASKGHLVDVSHNVRPTTAATWKTWRDVNTSDAYKDVKKYIRDNDLMDEEREAWIKSWIADVEHAMGGRGDLDSAGGTLAQMSQRTK
ncbi:hypothetical protein ElyMa_001710400 [Elysia marginata]|uniref:Uncharacterized protein n=1 Tax=Elysia marginata TaxID=1093978 RepID=A0AAV4JTU2_9GAST|nr:hypothetical protein ElyMa_001710400 [Elysia marginata]